MKTIIFIITLLPLICLSNSNNQKVPSELTEILQNSKKARNDVENSLAERMPANSIDNWNEFEQAMTNDTEWSNQLENIIEEHN